MTIAFGTNRGADDASSGTALSNGSGSGFTIGVGDFLVAMLKWEGGGSSDAATCTFTDSSSNTWTSSTYARVANAEDANVAFAWCLSAAANATSLVVTGTLSAARTARTLKVARFTTTTGVTAGTPVTNTSTTNVATASTAAITAATGDVIVAAIGHYNSTPTLTAGGNFIEISESLQSLLMYDLVASGGSITPTATIVTQDDTFAMVAVLFTEGSAAPTLSSPTPSGTLTTADRVTLGCTTDTTSGTIYAVLSAIEADITGITSAQVEAGDYQDDTAADYAGSNTVSTTTPSIAITGIYPPGDTLYYALSQGGSNVVTGSFTLDPSDISTPEYVLLTSVAGAGIIPASPAIQAGEEIAWATAAGTGSAVINADGTYSADEGVTAIVVQRAVLSTGLWDDIGYILLGDATVAAIGDLTETGVALSGTVTFDPITPTGADVAYVTVTGSGSPEFRINAGAYSSAGKLWQSGDTITPRHTSSASSGTAVASALDISGETVNFTSTTSAAPTDISLSNSTVLTTAGLNAVVGTLSTADADVGDTFTYTMAVGAGDTDNALFNISGDRIRATDPSGMLNAYSVRIQTDDGVSTPYSKAFTLTVVEPGAGGGALFINFHDFLRFRP